MRLYASRDSGSVISSSKYLRSVSPNIRDSDSTHCVALTLCRQVICESESGPAECRCRSGFHKGRDGLCYQEYTQADCPTNNVFIQGECVAKG